MISKKDFTKLFLELTETTVPHGLEYRLEKFLPTGYKTDKAGMNYYIEVGQSDTLFECHMDTAGYEPSKVTHVIEGDIIKTDGSTRLGGDNKCGMAILLCMIKERKPGTYFFFIGEERNGIGSRAILESDPNYFKKFKRSIAFDRRGYGSVVNVQFGRPCCSPEFEVAVVEELKKNGADGVLFTSSSTVENFFEILGNDSAMKILDDAKAVAIGPVTAETLKQKGVSNYLVAEKYNLDVSMFERLINIVLLININHNQ